MMMEKEEGGQGEELVVPDMRQAAAEEESTCTSVTVGLIPREPSAYVTMVVRTEVCIERPLVVEAAHS